MSRLHQITRSRLLNTISYAYNFLAPYTSSNCAASATYRERDFTRLEVFEKAATKKDNHNHPNSLQRVTYRNGNIKISGNTVKAQVQSGATVQEAMQPSRAERLLYDSCAHDFDGANQRLPLEKNLGQPFKKACSKSCGSSSAQGGHRIRLRPQWPGVVQRRPLTQASPIQISRKVIA